MATASPALSHVLGRSINVWYAECATPRRHWLGANVMAVPVRDVTLKGGKTFIWDDRTVDFIIYLYSLYMLHTCWMILFGLDWSLQTVHGPKAIKTRAPQSMPKSSHRVQMYINYIYYWYLEFLSPLPIHSSLMSYDFIWDSLWHCNMAGKSPSDETWGSMACPRYASAMDLIGDASSKKEWNPRVMRMAGSPERSWKHGITKKMAHLVDGSDRSTRPCAWNGWPKHQNMKSFQWPSVRPCDFETAISMFTAQKPKKNPVWCSITWTTILVIVHWHNMTTYFTKAEFCLGSFYRGPTTLQESIAKSKGQKAWVCQVLYTSNMSFS